MYHEWHHPLCGLYHHLTSALPFSWLFNLHTLHICSLKFQILYHCLFCGYHNITITNIKLPSLPKIFLMWLYKVVRHYSLKLHWATMQSGLWRVCETISTPVNMKPRSKHNLRMCKWPCKSDHNLTSNCIVTSISLCIFKLLSFGNWFAISRVKHFNKFSSLVHKNDNNKIVTVIVWQT